MKRGTAVILAGAVALASAAYAIGTQVGGGDAAARDEPPERGLRFAPGEPFGDLADELGVDSDELRDALRDFREQRTVGPRDELAAALADVLGKSTDEVEQAFEELRETTRARSAERLARALGLEAADVEDALEKVMEDARADRAHRPGDFIDELAAELGVTTDRLEEAFRDLRPGLAHPPSGPPRFEHPRVERPRLDHPRFEHAPFPPPPFGHGGAALEGLEQALGVTRTELRDAFREVWERRREHDRGELAEFLAERFNLAVDAVEEALRDSLPP